MWRGFMPARKNTTTYRNYDTYGTTWRCTQRNNITSGTTYPCGSPAFKTAQQECQWRMGSYRNIYQQFTGTGTRTTVSPSTAGRWTRYVNNGYQVYKFTNKDFCRYFGARWAQNTPKAACQYLRNHFGTAIKDVTRGKGNCWLVATTRTPTARPFNTYTWK
jgi:hypothetical protein